MIYLYVEYLCCRIVVDGTVNIALGPAIFHSLFCFQCVNMAHEKLQIESKFTDFNEFKILFDEYKERNQYIFNLKHATSVESYNKRLKTKKFPDCWKYQSAQFQCKHFGSYKSAGVGKRNHT